jgi:hypothetical protein
LREVRRGSYVKIFDMEINPPRTPWNDFPDVLIHANESAVKHHAAYAAAKSGDGVSAALLVNALMSSEQNEKLRILVGAANPTLVSAHAYEREGVNAIPEIFADAIGLALGWEVESAVVQTNVVSHTGADGFTRLARQAEFAGEIQAGKRYVIVDDFVGMGGTLANLKGYIESQGGIVIAAVSLTGKPYSAKLTPSPEQLLELREKHGTELEQWWQARFAHGWSALTHSEARYLARTQTAGLVRDRIAAAI